MAAYSSENILKKRFRYYILEAAAATIDCLEAARLVKKLAHTHRFEHESSGFKSKHLTTTP